MDRKSPPPTNTPQVVTEDTGRKTVSGKQIFVRDGKEYVSGRNGGLMRRPFQPGESGNPDGRPRKKPITDAWRRIGRLGPVALLDYAPKTAVEAAMRRVLLETFRAGSRASVGEVVMLLREMADRLDGKPIPTEKSPMGSVSGAKIQVSFDTKDNVRVNVVAAAGGNGNGHQYYEEEDEE